MERIVLSKRPYKYTASYYRKVKYYVREGKKTNSIQVAQGCASTSSQHLPSLQQPLSLQVPPQLTQQPLISTFLQLPQQCTKRIGDNDYD